MLLNPLSVYTTNLQDNWYEDGMDEGNTPANASSLLADQRVNVGGGTIVWWNGERGKRRVKRWGVKKETKRNELPRELRRNHGDR